MFLLKQKKFLSDVIEWYKYGYNLIDPISFLKSIESKTKVKKMQSKLFSYLLVVTAVFGVVFGLPAQSERKGKKSLKLCLYIKFV